MYETSNGWLVICPRIIKPKQYVILMLILRYKGVGSHTICPVGSRYLYKLRSRYLQMLEIFTLQPNLVLLLKYYAVALFERLAVLEKGKDSHDNISYP